jgi:hypothetical protein
MHCPKLVWIEKKGKRRSIAPPENRLREKKGKSRGAGLPEKLPAQGKTVKAEPMPALH